MKVLKTTLRGITIIAALCVMTALLVIFITGTGSELSTSSTSVSAGIGSKFDDFINNAKSEALDGIVPIKKMYRLDRANPIAPEPEQGNFGETEDPAVVEALLEKAAELTDGQEMVWNSNIQLRPGSKLQYYYDETILVLTWKEVVNRAVYTFSEVKIADPSQFRRYLADNTFGSSVQYATSDMAATVNAVMAMSGDFYKFRSGGMVVYEGSVKRLDGALVDTCCIDSNGDLIFVHKGEITDQTAAEKFVQDNDIIFSLAFGPILIENGVNVTPGNYVFGEINDIYARAAIGQMDSLHYLLVTVNTEEPTYTNAATVRQLGDELVRRGVPNAYTMDGGQTATIVVNDKVINSVEFGFQRNISDIIYFATALPELKSE